MDENGHRVCSYTRGQIGWSDLFVELRTADESWAGTDDDVWIDIGDHEFVLDNLDIDDRERGNIQGYAIWAPWLRREDIRRVLIRKGPDGFAGGWRLARVRVWFRGELMCDQSPNRWLEDDDRIWSGCVFDREFVNTLRVKVTTADEWWAGTDDDVTLTVAGRSLQPRQRLAQRLRAGQHRHLRPRPGCRPSPFRHRLGAHRQVARRLRRWLEAQGGRADRQRLDDLQRPGNRPLARGRPPHLDRHRVRSPRPCSSRRSRPIVVIGSCTAAATSAGAGPARTPPAPRRDRRGAPHAPGVRGPRDPRVRGARSNAGEAPAVGASTTPTAGLGTTGV